MSSIPSSPFHTHPREFMLQVRKGFVKKWAAMEHRMLYWRMANVAAAKARISELDLVAPCKDKGEPLAILELKQVEDERPSMTEMGPIDQWASDYVENDARNLITSSNKDFVAIHADKFEVALDDDPALGPLCTKEGVHCKVHVHACTCVSAWGGGGAGAAPPPPPRRAAAAAAPGRPPPPPRGNVHACAHTRALQ
jgi:hypothetical protein